MDIDNIFITPDMASQLYRKVKSSVPTPGDLYMDEDHLVWVMISDTPISLTESFVGPLYPALIFRLDTDGPFPEQTEGWPNTKISGRATCFGVKIGRVDLDTGIVYDVNNDIVVTNPEYPSSLSSAEWRAVLKKFFRQLFPKERIAILEAIGTEIPEVPLSACNMKTILTTYAKNRIGGYGQYRKVIKLIDDTIENRKLGGEVSVDQHIPVGITAKNK